MIRVGVVRSNAKGQEESHKTGSFIISHLMSDPLNKEYKVVDIVIDEWGTIHMNGRVAVFTDIKNSVDVVFNLLYEDSVHQQSFQQALEQLSIPHTLGSVFSKTVSSNISLLRNVSNTLGIKSPSHKIIASYKEDIDGPIDLYANRIAKSIWEKMAPPWQVRSVSPHNSFALHVCKTFPELVRSITLASILEIGFIVEELLDGRIARIHVLSGYREQNLYTFPPVDHKNLNNILHLSDEEKNTLYRYAILMHKNLNFSHFSFHDFLIHPKRGIYLMDSKPHLHIYDGGNTREFFENFGLRIHHLIDHLLKLTLRK